jgi:hypothetical protein
MLFLLSEPTAARRRVYIHCVDATDGITPETGEATGQPQISKNGAAFANTSATLVAVSNGLYYVELTATELNTLGVIVVRYKSAAVAEAQVMAQVVAFDPFDSGDLGLGNLDAAVSTRSSLSSANIETAVANVMDDAIPGSPTADSINERLKSLDDAYTAARAPNLDYLDASTSDAATPAEVNAQILDVMATDTHSMPSAGAPPAAPTYEQLLMWLYTAWRNKFTSTNSERRVYADDESTTLTKSTISDNGTTYTRGEFVAP